MYKKGLHFFDIILFATVMIIIWIAAMFSYRTIRASGLQAPLDVFTCTPTGVAAFIDRVHVRCSTPGPPGPSIYYFAFCSPRDPSLASRYLSIFTTAKVTAKNLDIFYDPSDTSGTSCGCSTSDCRVIWGVEVKP